MKEEIIKVNLPIESVRISPDIIRLSKLISRSKKWSGKTKTFKPTKKASATFSCAQGEIRGERGEVCLVQYEPRGDFEFSSEKQFLNLGALVRLKTDGFSMLGAVCNIRNTERGTDYIGKWFELFRN